MVVQPEAEDHYFSQWRLIEFEGKRFGLMNGIEAAQPGD